MAAMGSDLLCPCCFLIPLRYNDGRDVEPERLIEIKNALDRQFGGFTGLGVREGSWFGQVEQSMGIEVSVPEDQIEELRATVKAIGRALGQKQMYFKKGPPCVDLIDVEQATSS